MVNEIVTKFKFLGNLAPQRTFNENLKVSIGALGAFAAASKLAAVGAFAWASGMFGPIDTMGNLASETNNSAAALTKWGYVATQNNSGVEQMASSMTNLTMRMGEYAKFGTGSAKEAIESLGLSVKNTDGTIKNSSETMLDIADAMRGLSEGEQLSMLDKLGIDASMLQTLRMTRGEIIALQDEAGAMGVVSDEDTENVLAFGNAMGKLKFGMTAVQNMVAVAFAPMMTDLVGGFSDALAANRDWIVSGLKWLGQVIVATSGFVSRMWPILLGIAAAFVIAKIAAIGFGSVLATIFSPVVLITAAIVAVVLIIDDLITAFQGGKSVIADFFMEFFGWDIVPVLQGIVDAVMWVVDAAMNLFSPFFDYLSSMFKAVVALFTGDWDGAMGHLGDAFSSLGEFIMGIFTGAFDAIMGLWGKVASFIKEKAMGMLPQWAIDLLGGVGGAVSSAGDAISGAAGSLWSGAKSLVGMGGDEAVGMAAGGKSNTSNVTQTVEMNINSSDPYVAGTMAAEKIREENYRAKQLAKRGGQ